MSGACVGTREPTSVTDGIGSLHDIENLYIAGPSLLPTSSSSNITLIVHASAAQHMLKSW